MHFSESASKASASGGQTYSYQSVVRRLDSREHLDAISPVSLSSGGSQPLDLTVASKDSKDSSLSNDNMTRITSALHDNELDISLENETKGMRTPTPTNMGRKYLQPVRSPPTAEERDYHALQQLKRQAYFKSSSNLATDQSTPSPLQRNPLTSKSMEYLNARVVDIDIGEGGAQPAKPSKSNQPLPLNSSRLRAVRQRTRNAFINILHDGWVCLELIKQKGNVQKVVEVVKISPDGMQIQTFQPVPSVEVGDSPPPPPANSGLIKHFSYEALPQKCWRKYHYAVRFVNLVRSKTPKVTIYTDRAKCMLMENAPTADFEVIFYDGTFSSVRLESLSKKHFTMNIMFVNKGINIFHIMLLRYRGQVQPVSRCHTHHRERWYIHHTGILNQYTATGARHPRALALCASGETSFLSTVTVPYLGS